jgi:hypothetical protein
VGTTALGVIVLDEVLEAFNHGLHFLLVHLKLALLLMYLLDNRVRGIN